MESIKEKYEIIRIVGEGSFGRVYEAVDRHTNQVVALKQIKDPQSSNAMEEMKALVHLKHPTIVALHGVECDATSDYLVLEFMDATLDHHIRFRNSTSCSFAEDDIRSVSFQILEGLDWMHRQCGYMHRDLKPSNLLVDDGVVKISDLGSATKLDSRRIFHDYVTTRFYRAPEMLIQTFHGRILEDRNVFSYDEKVDMWSVGTIIAEMYVMSPLFMGENFADQLYKICEVIGAPTSNTWMMGTISAHFFGVPKLEPEIGCGFRARIPNASDLALDLITRLCSWDPEMRPSAVEALQHPFFTQSRSSVDAARSARYRDSQETRMTYAQALQKGIYHEC